ncbi:MAG: hypothetical protein JWQ10_3816 [Herbaspirillum sp.]|nr:hypothetical protein [Herbaspirillum sp.]
MTQVSAAFAPILSRIDDAETRAIPIWLEGYPPEITWNLLTRLAQFQDKYLTPMQRRMCNHFRYLSGSVETLYYVNEQDLIAQLTAYLSQRVLAYAPQPVCDEAALLRKIQHEKQDEPDLAPTATATELAAAKKQFLNDLPADRIIQARARELLRLRALPYSTDELNAVIAILASNINRCPASIGLDDVLDLADGMFSSPTIETIVTALASGDLKRILGLLPFVMPAYDVEEGLRAGDTDRALEGAVNLGKDALFTLLQGGVEAGLQRQLARDALLAGRMHLPAHEAASVALLRSMANHFPSLEAEQLSARRTLTDPDPFDLHAASASTTDASFDALRERVRNGESVTMQTPDRQHVQLLELSEQERVVPARPTEGGWAECNLRGETVLGAPPILRSPESGRHYALTDMPGVPGGAGAITDADLQNRPTVRAATDYLYAVSELPEVTRADKNPRGLLRKLIHYADTAAFREFEDFFVDTYKNSATMRIMMNSALMRKTKSKSPPCTVHFDAQKAHWSGNDLYFLSDEALKRAHYLSPDGPVSFQRQRMWIHETVHLLTELSDLENTRKEASSHRGPVVYFTDRIQYEIATGMPVLSRMNYARAPFSNFDNQPLALARPEAERINTCRDWMIAEDNYLDQILGHDLRITAATKVLGLAVVDRATVRGALALRTHFKTMQTLIPARVDAIVSATMRNLDSLSPFASHRPISDALLRSLISKSKLFRRLCIAWLAHHRPMPLSFELFDFNSVPGWRKTTLAHHLAADGNTMWINVNPIYYFTEYGNEKMSLARKVMGSLIDVIMREALPSLPLPPLADAYAERGLRVLLENRVMAEIGETATPRLCAALSEREDAYLRTLTAVARAVRSEDAFLKRAGKTDQPSV